MSYLSPCVVFVWPGVRCCMSGWGEYCDIAMGLQPQHDNLPSQHNVAKLSQWKKIAINAFLNIALTMVSWDRARAVLYGTMLPACINHCGRYARRDTLYIWALQWHCFYVFTCHMKCQHPWWVRLEQQGTLTWDKKTWDSDMGQKTWDSDMGQKHGTLTWDSDMGLWHGTKTRDSDMGQNNGTLTWDKKHGTLTWGQKHGSGSVLVL